MCSRSSGLPGSPYETVRVLGLDGRTAVHGFAESVDHASQQPGPYFHSRILAARRDGVAQLQAVDLFQRHGEHAAVAEADHLRADAPPAGGRTSQKSPMATLGPRDSISSPATSVTWPVQRSGEMRSRSAQITG